MTMHHDTRIGLDGVAAAATVLSHVDGERGELVIAGERVAGLAGTVRFEALAGRLWALAAGASATEAIAASGGAARRIGEARRRAFPRLRGILDLADGIAPMVAMRAAVAALGPEDGLDDEATLAGGFAVAAAALLRRSLGGAPVAPDPDLSHAADMLRMIHGTAPDTAAADALDAYLVTAIDHGMNASTFAGRVVASTGADLFMATTAAYCALTGPLHGGAPGPVLDMLDAIGTRANIGPWIEAALARGERLMGFGHRIYKVRDPRLCRRGGGRRPRRAGAGQGRPRPRHQCRVLHGDPARLAEDPAQRLHAGLRRGPHRRMDGARHRAAADGAAPSPRLDLSRPHAGLSPAAAGGYGQIAPARRPRKATGLSRSTRLRGAGRPWCARCPRAGCPPCRRSARG